MGGSSPIPKPLRKIVGGEAPKPKAVEQPKVEAQMDNSIAGPGGPTDVELQQDSDLKAKRKGRRYSILTNSTGLTSKPTLSKKTLLG